MGRPSGNVGVGKGLHAGFQSEETSSLFASSPSVVNSFGSAGRLDCTLQRIHDQSLVGYGLLSMDSTSLWSSAKAMGMEVHSPRSCLTLELLSYCILEDLLLGYSCQRPK